MRYFLVSLLLGILLFAGAPTVAQPVLSVYDLDVTHFRAISAKFIAFDSAHQQISTLQAGSFTIAENGIPRRVTRVSCPPPVQPEPVSVAVMVDTYQYLDLAGLGTRALVDYLNLPPSEIGFTTMDKGVYVIQDLTMDRDRARSATTRLISSPGTHLQQIFYDPHSGGVPMVSGRPNRKILVLMTDLHCPAFNLDTARLWKDAARENISVYMLLFRANDYTGLFHRIAERTGGRVFERVTSAEHVRSIIEWISLRDRYQACEIEWESAPACRLDRSVGITVASRSLHATLTYSAPYASVPHLEYAPTGITFRQVPPGIRRDSTVTVTARNSPITIDSVFCTNSEFTVSADRPLPYTLPAGESMVLGLGFTPADSAYTVGRIQILSDACETSVFFAAGIQGKGRVPPSVGTLRLLRPNGGEEFGVGDTVAIDWDGVPSNDLARLEFSVDSGATWRLVADDVSETGHRWLVPNTPSRRCLARVTQLVGSRSSDSLVLGHPEYGLLSARFLSDNDRVIAAGGGVLMLWNAWTGERLWKSPDSLVVNRAYVSPMGEIYALAPSHIRVIDPVSMQVIREMKLPARSGPEFLTFSDDDRFARYGEKKVDVFRTSTGDSIMSLERAGITTGNVAAFRRDGVLIATSFGPFVQIRDGGSGALIQEWSTQPASSVASLTFSNDGSELAVGTVDNQVYLFDVSTGIRRRTISGHISPIAAIAYSPDDSLIATASHDWSARLWCRADGRELRRILTRPKDPTAPWLNNSFTDIEFSADGEAIVTANYAEGTRILTVRKQPMQSDISDSLWSIVAPMAAIAVPSIDMGAVLLGDTRDSLVRDVICNRGDVPVHVLGIDPSRGETHDQQIMSGGGDFILVPGECRNIVFQFMPMATGTREAWYTLRTTSESIVDAIHVLGTGFQPQLSIATPVIDFGRVPVGELIDTVVAVMATNVGTAPLTINGIGRMGPDTTQFEVVGEPGPTVLLPGESKDVRVRFVPALPGRASGRIVFHHNGPGRHATANLYGEGMAAELFSDAPSISFGDVVCERRRDSTIVLFNGGNAALVISDADVSGADAADFMFDGSPAAPGFPLTVPASGHVSIPISFLSGARGERRAELRFRSNALNNSGGMLSIGLAARRGTTGFEPSTTQVSFDDVPAGHSTATSFEVTNTGTEPLTWRAPDTVGAFVMESITPAVTPAGGRSDIVVRFLAAPGGTTRGARLTLVEDVCGSAHNIELLATVRSETRFRIEPVLPNPVRSSAEIRFHLIEPGRTELFLIDALGRSVATLVDEDLAPGEHSVILKRDALPSGMYFCVLRTRGQRAIRAVTIAMSP